MSSFVCKALSDGGVLVTGGTYEYGHAWPPSLKARSFVLYYHPAGEVNNIKEYSTATDRVVFPNPAQRQFTVTNTENASLQLYNMFGQEVLRTYGKGESTTINVDFLPQGVYVLKVVQDKGASVHKIHVVK